MDITKMINSQNRHVQKIAKFIIIINQSHWFFPQLYLPVYTSSTVIPG